MSKYPYQKMKNAELRRMVAERAIDLDLDSARRIDLIKALQAYDGDNEDEATSVEMSTSEEKQDGKDKDPMKGKVKLYIPQTGEESKSQMVFVGCNGRSWFIPKDKPVIVPKQVKNVLSLAVEKITDMPNGQKTERPAQRVPYNVLEEGPD